MHPVRQRALADPHGRAADVADGASELHVERGCPKEASTVTVIAAEGPHNVNDHESITAEGILTTIAGTMTITGSNNA